MSLATGIPRVLEALQSNDWALDVGDALDGLDNDDDNDDGDNDDSSLEFGDFEKATSGRKATDLDPASLDFGFDKADFEGLRRAIWSSGVEVDDGAGGSSTTKPSSSGQDTATTVAAAAAVVAETEDAGSGNKEGDGEDSLGQEDVEKVEAMMRKLLAVREMGAGMPEEQRRRLAARAVGEVMREL
ncbi:hypothetical protein MAPG_09607 [Magnaporthiopsis poae ATCC 64411]|uniref:Uncharacterized protein n=1 Tax=Magnaporthiopsis poae (strain ATCC 64411 / 73-15) TaxID=644358 RepID=A0A0C4EAD8_MAGP6|nr:hypothetical protein MAPG_09607 [Magnaporthiopsis poae ATCC 64411]